MALLQISEPGGSPDPHQRRHVVGIDLGTTHSLVAAVRNGVAECLPDAEGRTILPSAVRYRGDGRTEIGQRALDHVEVVVEAVSRTPVTPEQGIAFELQHREIAVQDVRDAIEDDPFRSHLKRDAEGVHVGRRGVADQLLHRHAGARIDEIKKSCAGQIVRVAADQGGRIFAHLLDHQGIGPQDK